MKLALAIACVLVAGVAHADPPPPPQQAPRGQLRQLLLQRFDRNHDGHLDVRERRQAARALHRLANKMSGAGMDMKQQRQRRFIRRFDRDGDGNVGPNEMPPSLADEMRPLDRDGDGWLQGNELP